VKEREEEARILELVANDIRQHEDEAAVEISASEVRR
jgi:hypothetical protein